MRKRLFFYCKIKKKSHPPLNFNNNSVKQLQFQKRVGVYLDGKLDFGVYRDGKLDFREHLRNMLKKEKKNQLVT